MGEKASRCWYPILMIMLCIKLVLQAAISFRAAPKAIHLAFSQFDAVKNQAIPTYKTISRWLTRIGLYKLNCPQQQAHDWALIVDNSIQVGSDKLLVILGVRLSEVQGKALTFEDVEPLVMELHPKSDAKIVCNALEKAQNKIGQVAMVCADDGPDLRGGIALFCKKYKIGRAFDITHKMGTFLKKIYKEDLEWQAFASDVAEAKKKMQLTEAAHLAPPNQRTKSRFLNIEILVHWGVDMIEALNNPNHVDKKLLEKYCGWINRYRPLIERLKQIACIGQHVRQHIRERGIYKIVGEQVEDLLGKVMESYEYNEQACQYAGMVIDFLHEQAKIIPFGQTWIGSSEIIESLFGKLKSLEQDQSKGGFTSLILGAAACVGKIDVGVIKAAMVKVRTVDVNTWMKEQIGPTILSKRRRALGSWRKKKASKDIGDKSAGITWGKVIGF